MSHAPIQPDEDASLAALHWLDPLTAKPDAVLDSLTRCAAAVAGVPMALVVLLDHHRAHTFSGVQTTLDEAPRDFAISTHTIIGDGPLEIPDARADPRFSNNPMVTGEPHVRFYFGVPLSVDKQRVGSLCIIDRQPRTLTTSQRDALVDLAAVTSELLVHRRDKAALQDSQARLADVVLAASDWQWHTDASHHFSWRSEGFAAALGIDLDLDNFSALMLFDELGESLQPVDYLATLLDKQQLFRLATVTARREGITHHIALSAIPKFDGAGSFIGYRGVAKDISALVVSRRVAAQRWLPLPKIAQNVPGMIYQFRSWPDGRTAFPYASEGTNTIYEVTPEQVREDASIVFTRLHPEDLDEVAASIEQSRLTLAAWRLAYRVLLPSRGLRWLEGHATPERVSDGSVLWHGFITDITERRKLEALQTEKIVAEQASIAKSKFLARASHQLRTPLNAVLGFTQLMQRDTSISARTAEHLEHVRTAGSHLMALVEDLLDLSSIEQGSRPLKFSPQSVQECLQEVLMLVGPMAAEQAVTINLGLPPDTVLVLADARGLKQVMINLLSNAIKFSPNQATLNVDLQQTAAEVGISVTDSGLGMNDLQRSQLFQPFNRLGAEASRVKGSGLGLVIARQLAEAMHGRLQVETKPGAGSCFTLWLARAAPAKPPQLGDDVLEIPPPDALVAPQGRIDLLCVEDDAASALLVQEALADIPQVWLRHAANGAEGLRVAMEMRPDVILSDLDMPVMGGIALVRAIRANPALTDTVCIALTSDATSEKIQAALAAGFDSYWTKPLDLAKLRYDVSRLAKPPGPDSTTT